MTTSDDKKPTYEELETMLAALTTLLMGTGQGSGRKRSRPNLKIIGQLMGEADDEDPGNDDDGTPICYRNKSITNEPIVSIEIAPALAIPIEIIGTHESEATLEPIQRHVDQGFGFDAEDMAGNRIRAGYYEVMRDTTIFACIQGMHVRIGLQSLFQALTAPEMHESLSAARNQFNEQNSASGATFAA